MSSGFVAALKSLSKSYIGTHGLWNMGIHFFIIQHIVKIDGIVSFNEKLR
jgi:hypothetical protein